jgi:hypothetical protein
MLRRASGFVLGVVTSNPFMRVRRLRDEGIVVDDSFGIARGEADGSDREGYGDRSKDASRQISSAEVFVSESPFASGAFVPARAAAGTEPRRPTPRPSSWRRRRAAKDAANGRGGRDGEDTGTLEEGTSAPVEEDDSTEVIPETPDASRDDAPRAAATGGGVWKTCAVAACKTLICCPSTTSTGVITAATRTTSKPVTQCASCAASSAAAPCCGYRTENGVVAVCALRRRCRCTGATAADSHRRCCCDS